MFKRIFAILMAFTMVISFAACNKDKKEEVAVAPQKGGSSSDTAEGNPDAWWQQYTTKPSGTTKKHSKEKTSNKKPVSSKRDDKKPTKGGEKSTAGTTKKKMPDDPFIKVDANTIKYDVFNSNGIRQGVVTLTNKSAYIDATIKMANEIFATSYTSNNAVSYSSTEPANAGKTLIYIFSSAKKSLSNLQLVVVVKDDQPVVFMTAKNGEDVVPFAFWPMAESGNETYNGYVTTFKEGCSATKGEDYYAQASSNFKIVFQDPNFKEFLTW